MQKVTKLESLRERHYLRILDQETEQSTRTCFLTNEKNIDGRRWSTWMDDTWPYRALSEKPQKGNAADNCWPIALPLMWTILTGVIAEEMYNYLQREKILPEEQKECKRGGGGTKDHVMIDKTILKDYKNRFQE